MACPRLPRADRQIARAERIQLAAHRGGVETRDARAQLDAAVDNHIAMEALIHTFGGPGLFIALGVIILMLIALAVKIRTL